ncbi:hypothetical protein [Rhizobium herbae]|uniref:Uncharacterized protein n=1 Tax=Rhizobium herbae TaxID=508661 RepID=A0ABS4EFQ3_9HYPH|nr:hypothetical protein [Rhizobium herbae]MBP1856767.1 hypothetical protein [Rhizobium herbae]
MANTEMLERAMKVYEDIIRKWNHHESTSSEAVFKARAFAKIVAESVTSEEVLALLDGVAKYNEAQRDYWTAMFYGLPLRDGKSHFIDPKEPFLSVLK